MSASKKAGKGLRSILAIGFVVVFVLLFISVILALLGGGDEPSGAKQTASRPGTSGASTTPQPQQPKGEICLPFSFAGATCEVGKEGTAWILPDNSVPIPAGTRFCWDNKPEEFHRIEYLIGGKAHAFNPAGSEPSGVSAYRFFPKDRTTLVYNLAQGCRAAA